MIDLGIVSQTIALLAAVYADRSLVSQGPHKVDCVGTYTNERAE